LHGSIDAVRDNPGHICQSIRGEVSSRTAHAFTGAMLLTLGWR